MKITKKELKSLIKECYVEYYRRKSDRLLMEDAEKDEKMVYGEGAKLPDATDQMLAKFPTLKHALVRLHSEDFRDFVQGIEYVSPKPTVFRINLTNGQDYTLKWLGEDFEATISGKPYYLGQLVGFQQALNKLAILYQEGPISNGEEEESGEGGSEGGEGGMDFGGGGGGADFPGGEEEFGGEEGGSEEGGAEGEEEDVSGEDIDFESDSAS